VDPLTLTIVLYLLFIQLTSCGSTPVLLGYLLLRHSCTWDKTSIFWLCHNAEKSLLDKVICYWPKRKSWETASRHGPQWITSSLMGIVCFMEPRRFLWYQTNLCPTSSTEEVNMPKGTWIARIWFLLCFWLSKAWKKQVPLFASFKKMNLSFCP
jgi:hypothetical protein